MDVSNEFILSLEEKLQQVLPAKRYLHTLGVAYLASALAMCHGASHRDALIAGLLHDCAKNIPEEELLGLCLKHNLTLSEHEKRIPGILHAAYGTYLAKENYKITQEDILLAIRNHTLGRPSMSLLEQIVFLADYLETERTQPTEPHLDVIRKIAFENLNDATYLVCRNTLRYFEESKMDTDPITEKAYEYYKEKSTTTL